jgi:hypothetical protein
MSNLDGWILPAHKEYPHGPDALPDYLRLGFTYLGKLIDGSYNMQPRSGWTKVDQANGFQVRGFGNIILLTVETDRENNKYISYL